jgi:PleD family two-component response regulator
MYTFPSRRWKRVKHLTCSFGLALHRVGDSIYQTVRQADTALYEAKENGRNRVCVVRG